MVIDDFLFFVYYYFHYSYYYLTFILNVYVNGGLYQLHTKKKKWLGIKFHNADGLHRHKNCQKKVIVR